jgi:hypothetical protein
MKKPFGALIALVCVACLSATEVDDLLLLNIATDKTTLATGDTAQIRVIMSNHSDAQVTLPQPSCGPYFFIRDTLGRAFAPPQNQCLLQTSITIDAHDSVTIVGRWAGEARTNTGGVDRLAPGSYALYGVMYGTHRPIQSRTVSVQLLP